MAIRKMTDLDLRGKRVFIRADLNVPQDDAGNITDDTRIRAWVPGIRHALERGRARDGDLPPRPAEGGRVQAGGLARPGRETPVGAARGAGAVESATGKARSASSSIEDVLISRNCR